MSVGICKRSLLACSMARYVIIATPVTSFIEFRSVTASPISWMMPLCISTVAVSMIVPFEVMTAYISGLVMSGLADGFPCRSR